jgi:hypothetical protein
MLKRMLLVLGLASIPLQLTAGILYSNISASFPLLAPTYWSDGNSFVGTTFNTTSGGNLSSIVFSLASVGSPVTGGLYSTLAGQPDTLLESWTFAPSGVGALTTLTSILQPALSTGTQYWFIMDNPGIVLWAANDLSVPGGYYSGNSFPLFHQIANSQAVGIQLNSVTRASAPEPATGLLLVLGCITLVRLKSGRRSNI